MSVAAVAKSLDIGWDTVNQVALDQARDLVYDDPTHLAGVRILGVDEHKWKHRRGQGDPSFVTVIVDLTEECRWHRAGTVVGHDPRPIRGGTPPLVGRSGPAVPRPGQGGVDGRVRRLPHRGRRTATDSEEGHGPVPRGAPGRRQADQDQTAHPAGHLRTPR